MCLVKTFVGTAAVFVSARIRRHRVFPQDVDIIGYRVMDVNG